MPKRCRNYLPWSWVDGVGPRVRPGLAQTGTFRQHLVVRNNPIGALFDAVRAFCSPLPQEQVGEDGYLAEEPSASTPEYTGIYDYGGAGYGGGSAPLDSAYFAPPAFGPPETFGSAQPSTVTPTPAPAAPTAPVEDPTRIEAAAAARAALRKAMEAKDCEGVRGVLDQARTYRGTATKTAQFQRWQPIATQAVAWLKQNTRKCGPA